MESLELLKYIPADDYETWCLVGMALKHEGYPVSVWDGWSRSSSKYKPGECERKWESFREQNGGKPVTGGTIYNLACEYGYTPSGVIGGAMGWDDELEDVVGRDYKFVDPTFQRESLPLFDEKKYRPVEDFREYISALFHPDEIVGYCSQLIEVEKDGDKKWVPTKGIYYKTAKELLDASESGDIYAAIGDAAKSGHGAYIRFNPLDGTGEGNSNVTRFTYCLIESDVDSIEKQYALYKALNLPIAFLVHSGSKSLHAIVRVDAMSLAQYTERVQFVYDICQKNGLTPDKNDKNPSRYSRMPGVKRNGNWQYIVARNIGAKNYDEWEAWTDEQNDNLPDTVTLAEVWNDLPPLKDELIPGILRKGHKLLLAGPPKAGKSYLLMQLCVCLAEGIEWLGHKCRMGRVLYVNLELDEASCLHRFRDIYDKLGVPPAHLANITIWNLRGRSVPMDQLAPFIIKRFKGKSYEAIVIDPIYKVITGDENNATDMSKFATHFDRIATEVGTAMIYCHHHSKGAGSKYANAVDRSSGSGVFARDPDAILDLTQLKTEDLADKYRGQVADASNNLSAWELTGTLREFPPMAPERIWFDWPVYRTDDYNFLAPAHYSYSGDRKKGKETKEKVNNGERLADAFEYLKGPHNAVPIEALAKHMGVALKTIKGNKENWSPGEWQNVTLKLANNSKILALVRANSFTNVIYCDGRHFEKEGNSWKERPEKTGNSDS